jgi:hypothetical protein
MTSLVSTSGGLIGGAGLGGLGAAIRLTRDGVTDLAVLERADDIGAERRRLYRTVPGLQRLDGVVAADGTVWTAGGRTSWYLDTTGRNSTLWPRTTWAYRRGLARFRPEEPEEYALS